MLQVVDLIPFPIFRLSDFHQGLPQSKQVSPGLLMKGELAQDVNTTANAPGDRPHSLSHILVV